MMTTTQRLAALAASAALVTGLLVLLGWIANISLLTSVMTGTAAMRPLAAVSFVLTGVALWLTLRDSGSRFEHRLTIASPAVVIAMNLLTLLEHATGWPILLGLGATAPDPLPISSAVSFVLLGCALLPTRRAGFRRVQRRLTEAAMGIGLVILAGYLYGVESFYQSDVGVPLSAMAPHAAFLFLVLGAGRLCAQPEAGLVALLGSATMGGHAVRRLLPMAIIAPLALGAVILAGQRRGWYGTEFGVALFALASGGVTGLSVWWTGRSLHRTDRLRMRTEHELRASEQRARLALDAARLGTFDWEIPQNQIAWSSRHEALWGFAPGEFGGTFESFASRVDPRDLPAVNAEVARCMADRQSFLHEFRVVHPDGSLRWIEGRGEFHFGPTGQALRMHGVVVDITRRKRTEEQQALQSAALNAAADAMVITDARGAIEWVNSAFTRSTGYTADEALGRNPRDLFKSGVHDRVFYQHLWETIREGAVWSGEITNRRKDGSMCVEDLTISPVRNTTGEIAHFIGVKRDVTERRRADDQLRDQAELLDCARDAIVVRSLDQRITYWNKGAERLYGWTAEEAVGQSVEELGSNRTAEFEQALGVVLCVGDWTGELRQTAKC